MKYRIEVNDKGNTIKEVEESIKTLVNAKSVKVTVLSNKRISLVLSKDILTQEEHDDVINLLQKIMPSQSKINKAWESEAP